MKDDGDDDGADQTDDVQPEEAAKPQKRYVPKREQSPQLLRQCAAERTLRGIKGHRRQRSHKVKQHVRKSQSQISSCALLKVSAYETRSYLSV